MRSCEVTVVDIEVKVESEVVVAVVNIEVKVESEVVRS